MRESTFFVAVLASGRGMLVGPGSPAGAVGLEVRAPGERTAAARGYALGIGWRRAARLLELGGSEEDARAETDVATLAGALVDLGHLQWPAAGGGRCVFDTWGFWLPPRPGRTVAGRAGAGAGGGGSGVGPGDRDGGSVLLVGRRRLGLRPVPGSRSSWWSLN